MKTKLWLSGSLALALGAAGCSQAPEPEEVAELTARRSGEMVRGMGSSMRMMSKMAALDGLGEMMSVISGTPPCGTTDTVPCPGTSLPEAPDATTSEAQAALVEKYLRERIFTEANVEGTEGDSTVFRINGDDVCSDGSMPASPECLQAVDRAELRIRATQQGKDGMSLELLIGPQRAEPMSLSITDVRVGMVLELGGIKDAVQYLDASAASQLPRVMVGRVELALTSHGPEDLQFQTSILEALRIEMDGLEGPFIFQSAKASPLSHLKVWKENGEGRASFALLLGPTEIQTPYEGTSAQLAGKPWKVSLSGLSYAMEARENSDSLDIAHLGLGHAQSFVSLGEQKLLTVDLNALSGRHFDLLMTRGADGRPVVSVTPEFDLSLGVDLTPLAQDPAYEVPSYFMGETYRVRLGGGSGPSLRAVPADQTTGFPGGLQVVTGELALSASNAQVTVPEGKCLVSRTPAPEGSHPLLGTFEARDCQ